MHTYVWPMTQLLKLAALDAEDLEILSAHLQDAVLKVGDIDWRPAEKRLTLPLNRFAWEGTARGEAPERRRSVLHLARVMAVKSCQLPLARKDEVLALLSLRFTPGDTPSGDIDFIFAGGATLRATVECIETSLADLGAAWSAKAVPAHEG